MVLVAQISLVILAVLVLVGGVIGFTKAQSKASLIAGVASSILLAASFVYSFTAPTAGLIAGFAVTILLDAIFGMRLAKTKKFMPSGLMLILSGITMAVLALAIFGGQAKP